MRKLSNAPETQTKPAKRLRLDRTQVSLILGFVTVGLVLALGAGFIAGMWYQTNEQIGLRHLEPSSASTLPVPDRAMTFYSTLTRSEVSSPSPSRPDHDDMAKAQQPLQPTPPQASSPPKPGTRYSVQVGSFRARDEAEHLYTVLSNKGYSTSVKTSFVPGQGIHYRVRVGSYAERTAADRVVQRLRSQEHLAGMIMTVSP